MEQGVRREGQSRARRGADCTPEVFEARECTGCPGRSTLLCIDREGAHLAPPELISLWGYEMHFLGRFIYALWPAAVGCDEGCSETPRQPRGHRISGEGSAPQVAVPFLLRKLTTSIARAGRGRHSVVLEVPAQVQRPHGCCCWLCAGPDLTGGAQRGPFPRPWLGGASPRKASEASGSLPE